MGIQIYGRDVPQMVEAARIVEEARRRRQGDRDDDISALVLRVTENA